MAPVPIEAMRSASAEIGDKATILLLMAGEVHEVSHLTQPQAMWVIVGLVGTLATGVVVELCFECCYFY